MKLKSLLSLILPLCVIAACKEENAPVAAVLGVKTETLNFDSKGGVQQIVLETNCAWTAAVDADWVSITPDKGPQNTKAITVSVDENTGEASRAATVTISAAGLDDVPVQIVQNGPAGGFDGHIRTADDVISFLAMASEMTEGEVVELDADIDMSGAALIPAISWAGVLEGNGHSVYNFTVTAGTSNAGLILDNKGTVRNLAAGTKDGKTWDGVSTITFAEGVNGTSIGLVAVNSGLMEGVKNFAFVDYNVTTLADTQPGVGGVCGSTGSPDAVFRNCENYGKVNFSGVMAYKSAVGGVLGLNLNAGILVENCVNYATISQTVRTAKEFAMAGVVGRLEAKGTISGCRNEGGVRYECTEAPGSYLHIAGIAGAMYKGCEVSGCVNKADIYSAILQVNRIGGIVGTVNTGGTVKSCVNEGDVIIEQGTNANWQAAAGIVGFEEKGTGSNPIVITSNTNNGKVLLTLDNTTTHANKVSAAGIVGLCCSVIQVEGNTNNGVVKCVNTGATPVYAGGVIGSYIKGATLASTGNVNASDVTVEATDGAAGGVVGYVALASSSFKEETNRGSIKCSAASATGSIAGLTASDLTACTVGGVVNDVTVTAANFAALIQGSASTGTPVACHFDGEAPVSYLNVTPVSLDFVASGESKTVSVDANCDWTVSCSESWVSVDVAEGGESVKSVTVTAAENTVTDKRSATVTFAAKDDPKLTAVVTVNQAEFVYGLPDNKITSAADFLKFAALAPEAAAGDVYTLESDVVLGADFVPITSFAGTLDGKNHKITATLESGNVNVGLIETLTGTVKNLVTEGSFKTTYAGNVQHYLAALAAVVDGGIVENCVNNADLELASGNTGSNYVVAGGLVGGLKSDGATVRDCRNTGKITITGGAPVAAGGVVGYGIQTTGIQLNFLNCSSSGDIELNHAAANWDYVGGIVGKMGNSSTMIAKYTISGCSYSGNVRVVKAPKLRAGAIAGSLGATDDMDVSNCVFTGTIDVTSTEAVDRLIGGASAALTETKANGTISGCTFDGTVKVVDGGNLYIGGVLGNSASAGIKVDGCKTTARSSIGGFTAIDSDPVPDKPKGSIGVIMARATNASLAIRNCKVAGTVVDVTDAADVKSIVITADNIADWMFKGSAANAVAALENNGFNAE